jgi:hypothetical protein
LSAATIQLLVREKSSLYSNRLSRKPNGSKRLTCRATTPVALRY